MEYNIKNLINELNVFFKEIDNVVSDLKLDVKNEVTREIAIRLITRMSVEIYCTDKKIRSIKSLDSTSESKYLDDVNLFVNKVSGIFNNKDLKIKKEFALEYFLDYLGSISENKTKTLDKGEISFGNEGTKSIETEDVDKLYEMYNDQVTISGAPVNRLGFHYLLFEAFRHFFFFNDPYGVGGIGMMAKNGSRIFLDDEGNVSTRIKLPEESKISFTFLDLLSFVKIKAREFESTRIEEDDWSKSFGNQLSQYIYIKSFEEGVSRAVRQIESGCEFTTMMQILAGTRGDIGTVLNHKGRFGIVRNYRHESHTPLVGKCCDYYQKICTD